MKALLALVLLLAAGAVAPSGQESTRFEALDLILDAGDATLGAYQIELADPTGRATVVGVEGGEHPAFREAPRYDPAALSRGRIVLAAFQVGGVLPRGETRVARLHFAVAGDAPVDYVATLVAAASADGARITPALEIRR